MKHRFLRLTFAIHLAAICIAQSAGKSIVPDFMLEDRQFGMAANFLQRYSEIVSLPESEENADRIRRVKEDGFKYSKGNDHTLSALPENADFSIDFNKGVYSASWTVDGKTLVECSFPAKVGLMKIENKKGLELMMIDTFRNHTSSVANCSIPTATAKDVSKIQFSDFFVKNGDSFLTSDLSNKTLFFPLNEADDVYTLVYDPGKYPLETLSNILITGYSKGDIDLDLKIKQYGYDSTDVATNLASLYNIFTQEGCVPYWGVKETTADTIKGLYLWKNNMGGYCHVVSLEVPISALSSKSKAKASLNCYVRLDNLKSIFADHPEL